MVNKALFKDTHGQNLEPIATQVSHILRHKKGDALAKLSKREKADIATRIAALDTPKQIGSVDFSRCTPAEILNRYESGQSVEFETIGPYLADYVSSDGKMTMSDLTPEDAIGLRLARCFRQFFPNARLISLIDDYNAQQISGADTTSIGHFSASHIANLRQSLVDLFIQHNAISHSESKDFLLVSEAEKVRQAEVLIRRLDSIGTIQRKDEEILFRNPNAENPLLREFHLRTKNGKWLCPTLDAAGFIDKANLQITHLVVLPMYMKLQQDKVWEILRILGLVSMDYHNIFYDPSGSPEDIVQTVEKVFSAAA